MYMCSPQRIKASGCLYALATTYILCATPLNIVCVYDMRVRVWGALCLKKNPAENTESECSLKESSSASLHLSQPEIVAVSGEINTMIFSIALCTWYELNFLT